MRLQPLQAWFNDTLWRPAKGYAVINGHWRHIGFGALAVSLFGAAVITGGLGNHTGPAQSRAALVAGAQSSGPSHRWREPEPPTTSTTAQRIVAHAAPARATRGTRRGPDNGDFNSCVRQKESSNNYGYSGYYHGAYNMTLSHWGGYGGYSRPEDAPPSVQDAKFNSDVAQGSAYMHQQYPVTSRACGM